MIIAMALIDLKSGRTHDCVGDILTVPKAWRVSSF
jgi:hypothetical protein